MSANRLRTAVSRSLSASAQVKRRPGKAAQTPAPVAAEALLNAQPRDSVTQRESSSV